MTNWYLDRGFSMIKKLLGIARVTVGKIMDMPLPSKEVMDSVSDIKDNIERVKAILEDPQVTTVRLVLNPEQMVIKETMRAYTYLCLYNKNVEALVINRVLPEAAGDGGFFKDKLKEQEANMELIHHAFDPMVIKTCEMMPTELRGLEKLDAMADMVYGSEDPIKVYSSQSPMSFEGDGGRYRLVLSMPFVESKDVELFRIDASTLMVHVGSQKRNILLPDVLREAELSGADFKDNKLIIRFKRD